MLNLNKEDATLLLDLVRCEKRNIQVGFSTKFSKDDLERFESMEHRLENLIF